MHIMHAKLLLVQGAKAGAAAAPPAAVYNAEEFKQDLATSVQPIIVETVDQLNSAVQSAEQDIAACLQQQLAQAQQASSSAPKTEAVQKLWDVFALLRSQSNLCLPVTDNFS